MVLGETGTESFLGLCATLAGIVGVSNVETKGIVLIGGVGVCLGVGIVGDNRVMDCA